MSPVTTHVLDTTRGRPAAGVPVILEQRVAENDWRLVGHGETDADGRLRDLMSGETPLTAGVYRLVFDTGRYFEARGSTTFYPQVIIVFETVPGEPHYHVPLLLGAFGYTTYRGS